MYDIFLIIAGLALLYYGGEFLIKGAVSLAQRLGLSRLLIGAVVIGFGTSMPEMTVSVGAALRGSSEIAIGNIVGSNIANILLIIGIASLISPIAISASSARRDTITMITASLLLCALSFTGIINFLSGCVMFSALLFYIAFSYRQDKKSQSNQAPDNDQNPQEKSLTAIAAQFYSLSGLALLIAGAYLMIEGATSMARDFGISETIIGLTIVAVGTSLPELATSIVAALRKQSDIIIGNIVGSNIFNILAILGITAIFLPIPIVGQIAQIDIWIMLGVTFLLSAYLLSGKSIGRISGAAMVCAYIGYTLWLYVAL